MGAVCPQPQGFPRLFFMVVYHFGIFIRYIAKNKRGAFTPLFSVLPQVGFSLGSGCGRGRKNVKNIGLKLGAKPDK